MRAYTGKYKIGNDTLSVIKQNDGLYMDVGENTLWKIHFSDHTHFFFYERNLALNFITNSLNKIIGFTLDKETATKIE
jgi:hypothetical protein